MSKARENYSNHIVAFQHTKTNMLLGQTHTRHSNAPNLDGTCLHSARCDIDYSMPLFYT